MESRDTSARSVSGIAEKIRLLVGIQKKEKRRYCVRIKSVVAYEELSEHLESHAIR
jgi:hypothetical protein